MNVFWFLPTHGDGHFLGTSEGARPVSLPYLKQIAQAADSLGYYGVLIPTGRSCEDSWVVASALAPLTERLRYLVAIRPGIISPTVSARMAATLDRLSGGRLLINVVTGGDPDETVATASTSAMPSAMKSPTSSCASGAAYCRASPWTSPASTCRWRTPRRSIRRSRSRIRRCTSAALPRRPTTSPPSRWTST